MSEPNEPLRALSQEEMRALPHKPTGWGPWRLDPATRVLYPVQPYRYELDLEELTTSAKALDAIAQVAVKAWPGQEAVTAGLVHALTDVIDLQANLCSGGQPLELTRVRVRELVARAVADGRVVLG